VSRPRVQDLHILPWRSQRVCSLARFASRRHNIGSGSDFKLSRRLLSDEHCQMDHQHEISLTANAISPPPPNWRSGVYSGNLRRVIVMLPCVWCGDSEREETKKERRDRARERRERRGRDRERERERVPRVGARQCVR
jgi:hypothetical protein